MARHTTPLGIVLALGLLALVVGLMNVSATPPSNFIEAGSTGGEKNGDSLVLNSSGSDAVETWSTASVPPKDDVSNVYAVSRSGFDPSNPTSDAASGNGKEVFFGAERVVNNGDTHMDFEFTQAA